MTSPSSLRELIADRGIAIGDGAYGTRLQQAGLEAGECGERWNLDQPERVERIHRAYAEAGASFLTTNTFGGTAPRLAMHGLDDQVFEVNRSGAAIARMVADEHPGVLVAGNIGPSGELIEPLGVMTVDEARALFAEQARGLAEGGADFILIETMSDMSETTAAIEGAREGAPGLEIVATMSFDTNLHTMMGVSPAAGGAAAVRPRGRRNRRQLRARPERHGDGDGTDGRSPPRGRDPGRAVECRDAAPGG